MAQAQLYSVNNALNSRDLFYLSLTGDTALCNPLEEMNLINNTKQT